MNDQQAECLPKSPAHLHIAIVLDRSGSMDMVRDETIAGYNEQVQVIRGNAKKKKGHTDVTLVLFNDHIKFPVKMEPASKLKEITRKNYRPDRSTAMLDAVGATMALFDKATPDSDEHQYLVIIISDGMENASREYTYENISQMIRKRQESGRWTFSYIGANQDLSEVHRSMGIPKGNMANYAATPTGSVVMFARLGESMMSYMEEEEDKTRTFISNDDDIEDFRH